MARGEPADKPQQVAGEYRVVIFHLGAGRQPVKPGEHVLGRLPVHGVADMPGGVEVAGPHRPVPAGCRRAGQRVGQPRGHPAALRRRAVQPVEAGPTGQDSPVTGSTATHTTLAWIRSAPAAVTVVVRPAHRGPVAEQNVASRSRWPRCG